MRSGDLVIARDRVIEEAKTLPLINTDDTDRKNQGKTDGSR
jgi:hypothetical protein